MSSVQQIEMARYQREVVEDMRHMLAKYCRIMAWDVPDADEGAARGLVLQAMKDALTQVEGEQ
jgi:hypothetical protein